MSKDGYHAEYYRKNKERLKRRAAERRAENPEKTRQVVRNCWNDPEKKAKYLERRAQWYKDYAPIARKRAKDWTIANPEKVKEANKIRGKKWREENKPKLAAKQIKRYTSKLLRTPKWLSPADFLQMEEFYHEANRRSADTGYQWHVDHIVPLQGKTVSGLHVPWNLRVIPAVDNIRKHNNLVDT